MQIKREFFGASILILIALGFSGLFSISAFAQTDDYGTTVGTYCPQLFQTVVRGSSGSQVIKLQKFLSDYYDIPPATIQTGYFGRITQGYVIQFQKEQGLPSYGIVGSMTRAAIARVCGGSGGSVSTNFSASPTSGTVPLNVAFAVNNLPTVGGIDSGVSFSIDFGDGASGNLEPSCPVYATNCTSYSSSHIYSTGGTYIAKLVRTSNSCVKLVNCYAPITKETLGTVTIMITSKAT